MTKKKIDNEVFLRFFTNLIFYPVYVLDKIIMFWKISETPSYSQWYYKDPNFTKVIKLKRLGITQSYRKTSIIRVVFVVVLYMNYLLFF